MFARSPVFSVFTVFTLCAVAAVSLPAAAHADARDKGETLLKQVAAAYAAAGSLTAEVEEKMEWAKHKVHRRGKAVLSRPNLGRIEWVGEDKLNVWDGTRVWRYDIKANRYTKDYSSAAGTDIAYSENPLSFLFNTHQLTYKPVAEHLGTEVVDGVEYQVVAASTSTGRSKLYIGSDMLVHRLTGNRNSHTLSYEVRNLTSGPARSAAEFAFTPPPGAVQGIKDPKVIPIGVVAPDFAVTSHIAGRVTLKGLLERKKAVLLHFWGPG
jgi:outer membrane lipoprotein-sorting protein